ncbi:MAG: peptide chain release factor N(5)-glutamine methyltransferase [Alphaproteobacteria bacterium]|nr:peptide chain release factor N(5)-glutamine methyltransferase [Alphaproteobacteria bacterium]
MKTEILSKAKLLTLATQEAVSQKDALLLLAFILKTTYSRLFFKKEFLVSDLELTCLKSFLSRRGKGEPIAKILQRREFYGAMFKTTRDTLDPRPETELIIDLFREHYLATQAELQLLDLGAGTGCIGLSLLRYYPNARCCFVDISEKALDVVKDNAEALGVWEQCSFIKSDWFEDVSGSFDAILSNPPYVALGYNLDVETAFDPPVALFAGSDGMSAYARILPQAPSFLKPDGLLYLEIGFDQVQKITQIRTSLQLLKIEKDLAGIPRTCVFQNAK